ncbi:MAG: hypothetical protein HKN33_04225 [Pyrinomonadaceae bacterium]|nr:hypothetical protein [Pyrinomonadaceae bacterium]
MKTRIFTTITAILLVLSLEAKAQIDFDDSFSGNGLLRSNPHTGSTERGLVSEIKRLSDGSYLVAGTAAGASSGVMVMTVQKLNPDGSPDTSFGGGDGVFAFQPNARGSAGSAMAMQSDGKIVVAGYSFIETHPGRENIRRETVIRLNSNGTLDTSFGVNGARVRQHVNESNVDLGNEAFAIGILPDGRIVTGGQFIVGAQSQDPCHDQARRCSTLSIYDSNGAQTVNKTYDIGGYPEAREGISELEVVSGGRIVAGIIGSFSLVRFNADGTIDTSFGTAGLIRNWDFFGRTSNSIEGIEIQPGGKILATGRTVDINQANGLITARFNSDGGLDTSYGTGGKTPVFAAQSGRMLTGRDSLTLPDGKIIVGGMPGKMIRLNADGTADSTFGINGVKSIPILGIPVSLQLEGSGKVSYGARTTLLEPGQGPVDEWVVGRLRSDGVKFDFDGDSRTDHSIFRPGPGEWWYMRSSDGGNGAFQFGTNTDTPVPADFTGDGVTDVAFWRESTGEWYVLRSEDQSFYSFPFGAIGDIAIPGDFDGDGIADPTVFRPSIATWFINQSSGAIRIEGFGANGDLPVVGDYDGDGKDDIGIYRPSVSEWWINRSADGLLAVQFGTSGDKTVQGDYTGDGKADIAFFRPSSGEWFVLRSEDSSFYAFPFGTGSDIPTPGDFDGDGVYDAAVFRNSAGTWFVLGSTSGVDITSFGQPGDVPLPSVYTAQ